MVALLDQGGALLRLGFLAGRGPEDVTARRGAGEVVWDARRCERVAGELREYFEGRRESFDLPLAPEGTPFQQAVWSELRRIPFGERSSYGALAARIGRPWASRAVGQANGANPIAVVIPCHRVVGSDGSLTGYGSGVPIKRWLLDHEAGLRPLPLRGPRDSEASAAGR